MKQLLYIIGVPGAGKTTLVNAALEGATAFVRDEPVPHCEYGPGLIQLGVPRALHGGTDALSMSIAPKVKRALVEQDWTHVLAEGDRLATTSFFNVVKALGWDLRVLWLLTPLGEAAVRRQQRGTAQNEKWVNGRVTKVYNLGRRFQSVILDGSLPLGVLVDKLREEHVIKALRGGL